MKRLYIILPFCLAALLASCHKEEDPHGSSSSNDGINFSIVEEGLEDWEPTKAVNVDPSYLQTNGFGVYAYYTGNAAYTGASSVNGVILDNRKVWKTTTDKQYNGSSWSNVTVSSGVWRYYGNDYPGGVKYKEYWPMKDGEKVTFFAYAPYNLWSSAVTTASKGAVPTIPVQLYTNGSGGASLSGTNATVTVASSTFGDGVQKDLLWGVQSTGYPYKDFTRPGTTTSEHEENTVKFNFRHALSRMRFNIAMVPNPSVSMPPSSWDSYAVNNTSYPAKTVFLLESVKIYSEDGLLLNTGTLSLDNTQADNPEWGSKGGTVTYNFGSSIIGTNYLWERNNTNSSSASNNRDKYSTLISRRTSLVGVNEELATIMGNTSNYLYEIPSAGTFKVEVKYHKLTIYYHQQTSGFGRWSNWTVYDGEDGSGAGTTVTGTLTANLEAGRDYTVNLILGNAKTMDIQLEVQPWETINRSYEYSDEDYEVIDWLTYDSDWIDYRIDDKVYIDNRVGKFTFRVKGGRYLYWRASLRKLNDEADFRFTDQNGVELTDTQGNKLDELAGDLGEDVYNVIYIRAHDLSSQTLNSATLRFYFYDNASPRHAVVPLTLINQYYNGQQDKRILEWTVVQNAN